MNFHRAVRTKTAEGFCLRLHVNVSFVLFIYLRDRCRTEQATGGKASQVSQPTTNVAVGEVLIRTLIRIMLITCAHHEESVAEHKSPGNDYNALRNTSHNICSRGFEQLRCWVYHGLVASSGSKARVLNPSFFGHLHVGTVAPWYHHSSQPIP